MYLLGYDLGSSFVKATVFDGEQGKAISTVSWPGKEMPIKVPRPGFAEQDPEEWWKNIVQATRLVLKASNIHRERIRAIGISYQMHGLVMIDEDHKLLRPSIIWCDSRAVDIGDKAFKKIGPYLCLDHLLNSPGNFTASKLAWVKRYEPEKYKKLHQIMLPGDYIAMKMTGEVRTTISGLSEGIFWDFKENDISELVLNTYGFDPDIFPVRVPTFGDQGYLSKNAANELGLKAGTGISYRAGDQPNNAFSLNVLHPGEVAATAGTSGVVYGVSSSRQFDQKSRINTFIHVNHGMPGDRYGVLMCLNGAGILNAWMRKNFGMRSYISMNEAARKIPVGSGGLFILPFGNGAERILGNLNPGSRVSGWNYNVHHKPHFFRAAQEAVAFALNYGMHIMESAGTKAEVIRAGNANMFLSPIFGQTLADITGANIELYDTDGSQGAARGAGLGAGFYTGFNEVFSQLNIVKTMHPSINSETSKAVYQEWLDYMKSTLNLN